MIDPGRNSPCPCGSGKKYKRCCLQRRQEIERAHATSSNAVSRALEWIEEQHPEATRTALDEGFFGGLSAAEREGLGELSEGYFEMAQINSMEWLLADGTLDLGDGPVTTTELFLGPGGPLLSTEGRAYLEALRRQPLQLYEVVESMPGEGLVLQDARDPEAAPCRVVERAASRSLPVRELIAARVIPGQPAVLSGAIYPFRDLELQAHQALDELEASERTDAGSRTLALARIWLRRVVAPPPRIVDASTGEAFNLVTDHYRVLDRIALRTALEDCHEVDGSGDDGWVRLEEPEATISRTLVAINHGKRADRIELFSRSLPLADDNRSWFEELAGTAVHFVTREIVDPLAATGNRPQTNSGNELESGLPPELRQELHQHFYRNWADEPIPALGDATPREAVKTKRGRRQVERLLSSYETQDARTSRQTGEEAMNFGFLWEAVGLRKPQQAEPTAASSEPPVRPESVSPSSDD